jgi:hypothetical protein
MNLPGETVMGIMQVDGSVVEAGEIHGRYADRDSHSQERHNSNPLEISR